MPVGRSSFCGGPLFGLRRAGHSVFADWIWEDCRDHGASFLLGSNRVLVVEPTDVLRRQTSAHFGELSTLRKLKVLPAEAGNPHVHPQKGRPLSADEWLAFRTFDVVVSTPASTSPVLEPVSPADLFDLIIFDEAHHAPADAECVSRSLLPRQVCLLDGYSIQAR